MRIQQIRGRLMIVTAFMSFVSIRVIRGPSFFCPRITRMNANRNPFRGESHSVQAGLPNCTVFRPRHLGTDYKVGNAPGRLGHGGLTACYQSVYDLLFPHLPGCRFDAVMGFDFIEIHYGEMACNAGGSRRCSQSRARAEQGKWSRC